MYKENTFFYIDPKEPFVVLFLSIKAVLPVVH
jgi:hypothetical protein